MQDLQATCRPTGKRNLRVFNRLVRFMAFEARTRCREITTNTAQKIGAFGVDPRSVDSVCFALDGLHQVDSSRTEASQQHLVEDARRAESAYMGG